MLIMGVMPLPPASSTSSRRADEPTSTQKLPDGPMSSSRSPARTFSFTWVEHRPPGTRLIVNAKRASPGIDDAEYARRRLSPSLSTNSVKYCPALK